MNDLGLSFSGDYGFPDFGTFYCQRIAGIDNQHFDFFLWVNLGEARAIRMKKMLNFVHVCAQKKE
jgi:hypothetical protein